MLYVICLFLFYRGSPWRELGVRRWVGVCLAFQTVGWRYDWLELVQHDDAFKNLHVFVKSSPSTCTWPVSRHRDGDLPILPFPYQSCPPLPPWSHRSPDPTVHTTHSQAESTSARCQPWTGAGAVQTETFLLLPRHQPRLEGGGPEEGCCSNHHRCCHTHNQQGHQVRGWDVLLILS